MIHDRILPLFALMVATGIFFSYVHPTWSGRIAETKAAIISDEQALVAASAYTTRQNALATERNAIDPENLSRLAVFLPDSVDNVGLILDLNALAARSGLSLSNIDVTKNTVVSSDASGALPVARANPTSSIDLSLSAVGTYTALQAFLVGIEKSTRLLDVQDIVVKSSDTGVYSYQMKLRIYWLR
jgi:Tfp pilus assembly protein PilO